VRRQTTTLPQSYHQDVDKAHGRIELRRCWVVEDASRRADEWKNLRSFVLVERQRQIGEVVTTEQCYYLTSLPADARLINQMVRAHWGIENSVHWVLDVVMGEDANSTRVARAP
jgi:predicted transposase YbfD/YdcC